MLRQLQQTVNRKEPLIGNRKTLHSRSFTSNDRGWAEFDGARAKFRAGSEVRTAEAA